MGLSTEESFSLLDLRKIPVTTAAIQFPSSGQKIEIELKNDSGRIKFQADINRTSFVSNKETFQLRHKNIYTLRRLDFNGNHKNPPGPAPLEIFEGYEDYTFSKEDHVHFYIDGYGEKWALPLTIVSDIPIAAGDDIYDKMLKFFDYCNVEDFETKMQRNLLL